MKPLLEILTGPMDYNSHWQIWAQRIDGEFKPESPARFGKACFEHGGVRDGAAFFADNAYATDLMATYRELTPKKFWDEFAEEAALNLIEQVNELAALERDEIGNE
jgi:hypothetical protein